MSEEPLSPLAARLLAAERASPTGTEPSDEVAARLLARLEGLAVPPASAPQPPTAPRPPSVPAAPVAAAGAKVLTSVALLAVGAVAGSGATWVVMRSEAPHDAPVSAAVVVVPPPPAPAPVEVVVTEVAVDAGPSVAPKRTAEPVSTLKQEQLLLDTARTALISQRATEALEALERHRRAFPTGTLAEQREALTVQALAASGDVAGAKIKAAAFLQRYPQSVYGPMVEAAISPAE